MLVIALTAAIAVVMFGLGLTLQGADFVRIYQRPIPAAIGLLLQILILPTTCFLLATLLAPTPALAVGMMLLAATPGGPMANLFNHLAGGNVALGISLTVVNSVSSLITLPIIINFSLTHFMGEQQVLPMQTAEVLQVCCVVIIPATIGIAVRRKYAGFAERMHRSLKWLSAAVIASLLLGGLVRSGPTIGDYVLSIMLAASILASASLMLGYFVPRLLSQPRPEAIAITTEASIHNVPLAIAIALNPTLLNDPLMAAFPSIYGVVSVILVVLMVIFFRLRTAVS